MEQKINLNEISHKIQIMKACAEELNRLGDEFPALGRNSARILASIRMLELNISDIIE